MSMSLRTVHTHSLVHAPSGWFQGFPEVRRHSTLVFHKIWTSAWMQDDGLSWTGYDVRSDSTEVGFLTVLFLGFYYLNIIAAVIFNLHLWTRISKPLSTNVTPHCSIRRQNKNKTKNKLYLHRNQEKIELEGVLAFLSVRV